MKPDHAEIAELQRAFRSLAERDRPGSECPEPDRLWEAVSGDLPEEQIHEVVDHTAACPACAEAWRLARQLARSADDDGQGAVRPMPLPRRGWRWSLAAAAAVVLALSVAHLWRTGPTGGPPAEYRDPGGDVIRSLLVDGDALPRQRFLLRWTAETGPVLRFDVRVATEYLEVIAESRGLKDPEYIVPERALEQVPTGERILWQVEALLEDGRGVASPTFVNIVE